MSVYLEDLVAAVRDLADIVDDPHVEDPTIIRWINRGIEAAWKIAAPINPAAFRTSASFTLVGGFGLNVMAVPANARQILHVVKDPTSISARRAIRRRNSSESEGLQAGMTWDLEGGNIAIEPFNRCAGSYAIYYSLDPTVLAKAGDALDAVIEPATEFIETYAAVRCLAAEESDSRDMRTDLAALEEALPMAFANLAAGDAETIGDVYNTGGMWPWNLTP